MNNHALTNGPGTTTESGAGYRLSDELARVCLPQNITEYYRSLAWADSICLFFLAIGLVGLKAPGVFERPLSAPSEVAAAVFTQVEEQPKPQKVQSEEQTADLAEKAPADVVDVSPVVAIVDSRDSVFPFPIANVDGITRNIREATGFSPRVTPGLPPARVFRPGHGEGGFFPQPGARDYPREALERRAQGTVTLYVLVDASGAPEKVEVKESSGFHVLDQFAQQWLKRHWRWLPGEVRQFLVPYTFELK